MKKIILLSSLLVLCSCKVEKKINLSIGKKCIYKFTDAVHLKEYKLKIDSCKTLNTKVYHKYYINDTLIMEGYSDRYNKEGDWKFYNGESELTTKVKFNNSELIGISKFKNLDTISWGIFHLPNKGFRISKPKKWVVIKDDENTISFCDTNRFSPPNLNISISAYHLDDVEGNIRDAYNKTISNNKNQKGIKNLRFKKVNLLGFKEVYEIVSEEVIFNQNVEVRQILSVYKDRFYLIQITLNKSAKSDFKVLKEIIQNSFHVYDTITPNKNINLHPNS